MNQLFARAKKIILFLSRFLRDYFQNKGHEAVAVPSLFIEVTNFCNSQCVFCANRIMKRERCHLDMVLFKKAIDEFISLGGQVLNFCTCIGDPLLDPHLIERAKYVRQFPQIMRLGFFTTLQEFHRINIDDFFGSGINSIIISSSFWGKETHNKLFGINNYDQTLENIKNFLTENKRRGGKIEIDFSIKLINKLPRDFKLMPDFVSVNELTNGALELVMKRTSFWYDDWYGRIKLPAYLNRRPKYPRAYRPCALLYSQLIIFSNGKVGACPCRDFDADSQLILGDIKNNSLKELWNGSKAKDIRHNWRKKNTIPQICTHCSHYLYY